MLNLIFTLDYEIHGNGEGCPNALMVEPTDRLLKLFDTCGAKLTIMADVAEIIRFKEYQEQSGFDAFSYRPILEQLQRSIRTGHDVQLHIHSSYWNARHVHGRWAQDWSEYNFAGLPQARMEWMVKTSKHFLEANLRPVDPAYRCVAFRAANWSVSPSQQVVATLLNNGIRIDTSVFKFGQRKGIVSFDYSNAHHCLLPWRANAEDICLEDETSALWEFPIYSEQRWVGAFATPNRIYRALQGRRHKLADAPAMAPSPSARCTGRKWSWLWKKHAWKADFNQCSGRQLIRSVLAAEKLVPPGTEAPLVLIGHSKLFTRWNAWSLRPLLDFVRDHPDRFRFGLFRDFSCAAAPDVEPAAAIAAQN